MSIRAIPIRIRLVLGFVLVMTVVLSATGVFVYERTSSDLDRQIDRELSARLAGVIAIVRDDGDDLGDPAAAPLARVDAEGAVQILGPSGDVVDATASQLATTPLLSPEQLDEIVRTDGEYVDIETGGVVGPLRIVADRTKDDDVHYTILVGASLEERDQALSSLSRLLLIGGPAALLLASLAAYWVAASALRPVEAMRRRAAEISTREPGQRLPVPPAEDEISELGTTLNAMLARLEAALERERRFVADASHELRTPLAILKAEVHLALAEGRSETELRAALASIGDESDRLGRLAEDLLVLARADEGRLPVDAEEVSVAEIAERIVSRRQPAEAERRIRTEIEPGLHVRADPLRLEQALSNLVENALRYGAGEVVIAGASEKGAGVIRVRDHGAGFPDDLLEHAFERFARGDGSRSGGGAGLGLAIVEVIVSAHGGSVAAVNRPQGGAEVSITFPLAGGAVPAAS